MEEQRYLYENSERNYSTNELNKRFEMIQLKRQLEVLATFVPNEILNYRLEQRQRNFVGILLFADVSGFTPLTEKYNKTGKGGIYRLTATLNAYIGAILEVIHLFGGDILKFSGDAFLALWKVKHGQSAYDILHVVVVCALVIQKNLGVFETEVNVLLKVKLAISCGNMSFSVIGSGMTKNFVCIGQAIYDVKNAEHVSVSGDVVIAPGAWSHMLHDRYITTVAEGGNVKVWKTIYRKNEEQKRIYFEERIAEVLVEVQKHMEHRQKINVKKTFESNSTMTKVIDKFLKSLLKRETIKSVPKYWSIDELRPFIIKPVQDQVEESQPVEYLTEMREVTIQFINIIPISYDNDYLIEMAHSTYKIICHIVGDSLGVVNKVSMFDKDLMILVIFGLRGIRHELESQHALRSAFQICKIISENVLNVASCSIGITQGLVYCGVVGHPFRREYTVIGTEVNKAARMMCAYPHKVICDYKTFKHSQLASFYFRLQSVIKLKGIEEAGAIYEYNEDFDDWGGKRIQKLKIYGREKEYNMIRSVIFKYKEGPYVHLHKYNGICFVGPTKIGKTSILLQSITILRKEARGPVVVSIDLNSHSYVPYLTINRLYDKLFDKQGTLYEKINAVPNLPRQLFKPEVDRWFPTMNFSAFKYDILMNFRKILQLKTDFKTIIFIDNIEHIDMHSYEILEIVVGEGLVILIATAFFPDAQWKIDERLSKFPEMYLYEITPIAPTYIALLACMFLDAVGIPHNLEYNLIHSCEGRPGYVQSSIVRLINNGSLQLKLINKSEKDPTLSFFPPEVNQDLEDIVTIVEFSEKYKNIGQELTLQAISLDLFDSFTPYQQLMIKTASVIGDMFQRTLLKVAMHYPSEDMLANVLMQLFEEEVFECGAKYVNANELDYTSGKLCCRCYFKPTELSDGDKTLPKYAYCKIIHFKNKSIREVAYDLLPGNQKKELHLLCTEVLETTKHACLPCTRQPILFVMHSCNYKKIMEYCEDPKLQYHISRTDEPNHGSIKKVIRNTMFGIRVESQPDDTVIRPRRDSRGCSCFDIFVSVFNQLRHHANQGKHTGKLVYYTMKYGFILLIVRDYANAIRYFRETIELCMVDADEIKQDPVLSRFQTIVMGRTHIGLTQAHLALGQLYMAKNHIIIALRRYNIPSLALEYHAFHELLKKTFVVNIRQIYHRKYGNNIYRFDCGNALAHCAKIFSLEGKWSLAKAAAMNSMYCLRTVNPNVSLLYEVYCNIIDIFNYADCKLSLEKMQKYVFQQVMFNFNSPDINNLNAIICLMESLLESYFTSGNIIEGIRLGYRMLDICIRIDYFVSDYRLFYHLPILLVFNGRIRDAGDVLMIFKKRMDSNHNALPIFYIVSLLVYILTGFTVEKLDKTINFASQLKRIPGKSKRLFEFLYTLVQVHYFRLGKFYKAGEWKGDNLWNSKEVRSTILVTEIIFTLQCMILQFVHNCSHRRTNTNVEAKRINKLLDVFKDYCKQYTIFWPMFWYMKAWIYRVTKKKKKSNKYLHRIFNRTSEQNIYMHAKALASSNAWAGGYHIFYELRPIVSYLSSDSYSLRQFAQFMPIDPIE